MKNAIKFLCFGALGALFIGCAAKEPEMTQLQIREFQTRTYPIKDTKRAMKAVLNVLQDEAYIVKEANSELGFLTAQKEIDIEDKGMAVMGSLFGGRDASWEKNAIIECTANVTEYNNEMRVRINFQKKKMDNQGKVVEVKQILDQKFYQEFFVKVDKGVFIEKENL